VLRKAVGKLTYANVMATVAVFIALGATAFATPVSDSASSLSKSVKKALKLSRSADKKASKALSLASGVNAQGGKPGPTGPQGPRGIEGLTGPQGPPGRDAPAASVDEQVDEFSTSGAEDGPGVTVNVPENGMIGVWARAEASIDMGDNVYPRVSLMADSDVLEDYFLGGYGSDGGFGTNFPIDMRVFELEPGEHTISLSLECVVQDPDLQQDLDCIAGTEQVSYRNAKLVVWPLP
jgi:hypothetical protein